MQNTRKIYFIVPTINSEKFIINFKEYHERFGLNLFFFVDKKTTDKTYEILKDHNSKVYYWDNKYKYAEGSIYEIYKKFPNKFIFRIDDDEALSPGLINYLNKINLNENYLYGFKKYEILKINNKIKVNGPYNFFQKIYTEYLRFFSFNTETREFINQTRSNGNTHTIYRLFFNSNKFFSNKIHTPGLDLKKNNLKKLNQKNCYIAHLMNLVSSYSERLSKIYNYELENKNSGNKWKFLYIPEEYFVKFSKNNFFNTGFLNLENYTLKKYCESLINFN